MDGRCHNHRCARTMFIVFVFVELVGWLVDALVRCWLNAPQAALSEEEARRSRPMERVLQFLLPKENAATMQAGGASTAQQLAAGTLMLSNKGQYFYQRVADPATQGVYVRACVRACVRVRVRVRACVRACVRVCMCVFGVVARERQCTNICLWPCWRQWFF